MPLTIDLTSDEEARLAAAAQRTGLAPAEFARKLVTDHLPDADPMEALNAKLREWQAQDGTPLMPDVPTRILFAQWAEEDAGMTDAEREAEDRFWEEFERGINETRAALGMRQL
jgi:microcystin degradation protein MlrC